VVPLRGRLGVLEERPFRLLWLARSTSAVGDALIPVAIAFAVLDIGSASDLGLVFAAYMGSRMLFIVIGGVWADRLPRQRVMVAADAVRALTQTLIAVAFLTDTIAVWQLALSSAVFGIGSAFFGPASTGLVPQIVPTVRLQEANALLGLSGNLIEVFGPALSGLLIASVGYELVFAIDAASFVASGLFLLALRVPHSFKPGRRQSFLADAKEGAREVVARTWLWTAFINFALGNLAMAPYFVLGPLVVKEELGGATDWGVIMTAGAVGGILGSAIALRFRPARPLLFSFPIMLFLPLQMLALVPPLPLPVLTLGAALVVVGIVLGNTLWQTVVQQQVPNEKLARVDALDWMVSLVFMPIGYLVAGPLAAEIGVEQTLVLAAALAAFAHLSILAVPSVRNMRRLEASAADEPIAATALGT
jgi:MFS family permease